MKTPPNAPAHRENPLHQIHRWSIEHGHIVIAFYLAVVILAGVAVAQIIPRRFAPYVASPLIGVVTMMPGLSATEMESQVSKPIEEQMNSVKGVRSIRSNSQDGASIVTLEFPYGTSMQRALTDVQALMNVTQGALPNTGANLKPSFIVPIDPLNLPVLSLAVRGDAEKGWNPARVREFADNEMARMLKTVPNVYAVVPFGGYRRQMQVVVDRQQTCRLSPFDTGRARRCRPLQRGKTRRHDYRGWARGDCAGGHAGEIRRRHRRLPGDDRDARRENVEQFHDGSASRVGW